MLGVRMNIQDISENLGFDVSRETYDRLDRYVFEVLRWTKRINLIAPGTTAEIWSRHVVDSLQLVTYIPDTAAKVLDVGSGGGFPGIPIAIELAARLPDAQVSLVDSDARKCVFLREMARLLDLRLQVHNLRCEQLAPQGADVLTARALMKLDSLLDVADRHLNGSGTGLFLKGESYIAEMANVEDHVKYRCTAHPSVSGTGAAIIIAKEIGNA